MATSEPAIDRTWQKKSDSFVITEPVLAHRVSSEQTVSCDKLCWRCKLFVVGITDVNVGVVVLLPGAMFMKRRLNVAAFFPVADCAAISSFVQSMLSLVILVASLSFLCWQTT